MFTIKAKRDGGSRCPLCSEALTQGGATRDCPGCGVGYHRSCFAELGGCGTLGCPRATTGAGDSGSPHRPAASGVEGGRLSLGALVGFAALLGASALAFLVSSASPEPDPSATPAHSRPYQFGERDRFLELEGYRLAEKVNYLAQSMRWTEELEITPHSTEVEKLFTDQRHSVRKSYELIVRTGGKTPTEVRADLRRRVALAVEDQDRDRAEEILVELFAAEVTPQAPPAPVRRGKRPLSLTEVGLFVENVELLLRLRLTEKRFGSLNDPKSVRSVSLDGALQAYENLLESNRQTPAEVRAELRRRVLEQVQVRDHAEAEGIMREVFATVDKDPVFAR